VRGRGERLSLVNHVRAIIADDEEALRSLLRRKLSSLWPELSVIGEAGDGEKAFKLIREERPDIAFLDIQMPGLSGIEVAQRSAGSCKFVFVTAYDKYAVEAFENEAIDYLLKPVSDERLAKTITRLKERLANPQPGISAKLERISTNLKKPSGFLQWIKAQHKDGVRLIPVSEVCFFKAMDKYTAVRTREGEFLIRTSIKELEESLDPGRFWRVHRAAIVNVKAIHAVARSLAGGYTITFKDVKDHVVVSRAYSHLFKQM
jgi:DNA-binding LytR/AlgR family response regulator